MSAAAAVGRDYTEGPIVSALLAFSLPMLGSGVMQSLNSSVNAFWVGRYLGPAALTATSNANLLLFLLLGAAFGICAAASILVGQAVGAKDWARAKGVAGTGATFFIVLASSMALVGVAVTPHLLAVMGTPVDARPLAIAYLRVTFLSLPGSYLFVYLISIQRAAGGTQRPFAFLVLSVALDIVLNPFLIFGAGPFHGLGIAGSALSSLIAQLVSLILMTVHLYRQNHPLLPARGELGMLRPDFRIMRALVFKGLPMGVQTLVVSSSAVAMISLVNRFGSHTTAGYGAAAQMWGYVQMPAMAIGAGVSAVVAQNIGAGKWDRAVRAAWLGVALQVCVTGALAALATGFDWAILQLFIRDPVALGIGRHINHTVVWSFTLLGAMYVLFGAMRGSGSVTPQLFISIASLWVIRIPFALALIPRYGAEAIWWAMPLGSVVALLLTVAWMQSGRWRRATMLDGAVPPTGPAGLRGVDPGGA